MKQGAVQKCERGVRGAYPVWSLDSVNLLTLMEMLAAASAAADISPWPINARGIEFGRERPNVFGFLLNSSALLTNTVAPVFIASLRAHD